MRYIHKSQKPIEAIGVYCNKWLMVLYVSLWGGYCTSYTISSIACIFDYLYGQDTKKYLDIIFYSSDLYRVFAMVLDCLILCTFLRLSNDIGADKVDQISQSLSDSFSSKRTKYQEDEVTERQRFERRQKEYKFIADE